MTGGRVRPFEPEDIPRVVALRGRAFHRTAQPSTAAAEAYFNLVFFANPWRDISLPSLVYEDPSGAVAGFLGVIARPMLYRGQPVRLAVSTEFMVDPGQRGVVGIQLLRQFLEGPQDLCFSDVANDASRVIWEGLGGGTAVVHSLYWTYALRPVRYAASRLGAHPAVRAARLLTRPLVSTADAALGLSGARRSALTRPAGLRTTALTARDIAELLPPVTVRDALVPVYDEAAVGWLLDRLAERSGPESVRARVVREADGRSVGWYVYLRQGVVGEVVQLAVRPHRWADVLRILLAESRAEGLAAVAGRLDPAHISDLAALGCAFTRSGPWALVHARRPELARAVLAGDAFLSRLESEWWMNF